MKNIIKNFLIICFVCIFSHNVASAFSFDAKIEADDVIYNTATTKINVIDPSVQNNTTGDSYPGYRGANQLVVYTSKYGKKTGTNEFGTEAIVVDGYVVSLSGADSLIPKNGFVISGHGKAKQWINENVSLGSKILIDKDNMTLTSCLTPNSFLFAANEKIKEVFSIMKYYSHQDIMYDYTNSVDYLKKSTKALHQASKQKDNAQKYSSTAIKNANKAIEYSIPYYENELKGVWIRPTEKNKSEITNTLDDLQKAGINNIFLETFYHSKTIYPSEVLKKYNVTDQRQEFVGFDPLRIWIEEAHKRNIKVHVWFECFYVGNDNPQINPMHVLNVYPQWANVTRARYDSKTPVSSLTEHNGYFLDPANPMVQDYLLEVLNEILTKYKPDGVNLDYIRYPQTVEKKYNGYENANWGYTQYARDEFKSLYGIDPIEINKNTQEWDLWAKYRQDKVSNFVRQASNLVKNKATLTAVIFPDRQKSLDIKMQDWKTWSINNYVDGFTPLLLSCDYDTAKGLLADIKNNSSSFTDIYAGLFVTFMNGSTDDLLRQVHMARQLKAKGVIIFENSHFTKEYKNALTTSAFTPLDEKSIEKIKSHEISNKKLQDYLDKAMTDFYFREAKYNKNLLKHSTEAELQKDSAKTTKPSKFAPDKELGTKGRFN